MFEGGIRVPAICRWPGAIPAATVCNEFLTSIMEIFPMLSSAAGLGPPKGVVLDGFDMTAVLAAVKARFEAWKKLMAEAQPRRPFRNF